MRLKIAMNSIYRTLYGELKKKRMTYADLAKIVNCAESSIKNKMNGKTKFSINEAIIIRNEVAPEMAIDELFAVEDTLT